MLLHSICLYILKKWQRWGFTQSMVYCIFHSMPPKISFWRGKYILVMFQFEKHLEFTFCRTMWRNIWGPALFLAPARKGTDWQILSKLDSIWKSWTCMWMLSFCSIDTLTDTDSIDWVDDTNEIIVVLLVCWDLYHLLRRLGAPLTLFSEESWLKSYQHEPHTF